MQEPKYNLPFQILGQQLRVLRESRRETVAEVSGAVEIEADMLERIEQGKERPSEEILLLLISYFGIQEGDAVRLWESAGYSQQAEDRGTEAGDHTIRPAMILLAIDARVMYSDGVTISGNQNGLVMHFTQAAGQDRPLPVARVGMSYVQAEQVLRTLQQALLHHQYMPSRRLLPPGSAA